MNASNVKTQTKTYQIFDEAKEELWNIRNEGGMIDIVKTIRNAWSWRGIEPTEVIAINSFGNVIVQDDAGEIWRICPEELEATKIASSRSAYELLRGDQDFVLDWEMELPRLEAEALLGEPGSGRCYCFKIPATLGGKYAGDNFGIISIDELVSASGNMAFQIKDIPDGEKVRIIAKKSN